MKIGIDARFYGPIGKGLGRYTAELIRSLEAIDTENEYVIFLRRENFDHYTPQNPRFRKCLADYRWYSWEEQVLFPFRLFRERLDLLHFPHFNVPILYRKPFVVTIHDLILLRFPTHRATTLGPMLYRLKFLAYRWVIRNAIVFSRAILTVSDYTKRDIVERYRISRDKIAVTFEAAQSWCWTLPPTSSDTLFRRLGLLQGEPNASPRGILKPYALYVGNAYPHKNLETLIDAFCEFPDSDARMVFVGGDDYFSRRLKAYAKKRRCVAAIFAGWVSDAELDTLYRFARVSVFPSRYEGFGLPPLEAMAKGSPVLVARAAAFPEILGDAAEFFDPDEPNSLRETLVALWNDQHARLALRERGYVRATRFSWERMGRETLEWYERE